MPGPWTPLPLDLEIWQGATWDPVGTLTVEATGAPLDLTGWDARMQIRDSLDAAAPLKTLTVGAGLILGGAAGTISFLISAAETASLFPIASGDTRVCRYDLELVEPGGQVRKALVGRFVVRREVTR